MDPFSQGFLGSLASQLATKKEFGRKKIFAASFCGLVGGILPDADIFIKSNVDTLMTIEYHRHFTHSLAFIPIGGLIAAVLCYIFVKKFFNFKHIYLFTTLGYATHGLLDGATSYGTRLLWPFTDDRISWSIISIVDPLFTLPLIAMVMVAIIYSSPKIAKAFCLYIFFYLSLGYLQNQRTEEQMFKLAEKRNHKIDHFELKPTIGNNFLWRSTYRSGNKLYADAFRISWSGKTEIYEGESAEAVNFVKDFEFLPKDSLLYNDISRFNFFSNDLVIRHHNYPNFLIDGRYSIEAAGTKPMWGIEVDLDKPNQRAKFVQFPRDLTEKKKEKFIDMIKGEKVKKTN